MTEHLHCLCGEVEYLCCPVETDKNGANATCRDEHPVEEAIVPVLCNWSLVDFLEFAVFLELVTYTGDVEHTCKLHNPPDENLYGEQRVANH